LPFKARRTGTHVRPSKRKSEQEDEFSKDKKVRKKINFDTIDEDEARVVENSSDDETDDTAVQVKVIDGLGT
jgi:hypothetical protein